MSREDRKRQMTKQLIKNGITNYTFFEAIDGNKLESTKELYNLFDRNNFSYKKGVIGCALSHLYLFKELINDDNNDYYVILEDDIELCNNFKQKIEDVICKFNANKIQHLSLGICGSTDKSFVPKSETQTIFEKNIYQLWNITFAYIISKDGAKKIIEHVNNCSIKCALDNPQSYGDIINYHCITDFLASQKDISEFGTDILNQPNKFNFVENKNNSISLSIAFCDWWEQEYCGGTFNQNNNFITDILTQYGNITYLNIVLKFII
jgi:GR25 family glycosyltransferase involved in LPS biosynthesis